MCFDLPPGEDVAEIQTEAEKGVFRRQFPGFGQLLAERLALGELAEFRVSLLRGRG